MVWKTVPCILYLEMFIEKITHVRNCVTEVMRIEIIVKDLVKTWKHLRYVNP